MLMNLDKAVVVFVPGVMGSKLRFRGAGDFGEPIDEVVWGSNLVQNLDVLATHPQRLASGDLHPDGVIASLELGGWLVVPLYGPLLSFCRSGAGLGLIDGQNLFLYSYDWRADNRETARKLGKFIDSIDRAGERELFLIAHSMGGLVCRLLLLADAAIASHVRLLFQIASPIRGSAKAFDSLRRHPRFDKLFDALWRLAHRLNPDHRARLMETLTDFASLYQLLPPKDIVTLVTEDGAQYDALYREAWPAHLRSMLDLADQVHTLLAAPVPSPVRCVYAKEHDTPFLYLVNRDWSIKAEKIEAAGDGTVTCASAYADSRLEQRSVISGPSTEHADLPANDRVLELLRKEISG